MVGERHRRRRPAGIHLTVVGGLLTAAFLATAAGASATTTLCVKSVANGAVQGPTTVGGSTCETGYKALTLPGAAELTVLNQIMPHIKYQAAGVGGKPTVQFSGVNVQIINGSGETNEANGEGNLVLGYDENDGKHLQTGSHDLVLGFEQTFTSFGGIVSGYDNSITAPFSSVTGGSENTASEAYASVGGGYKNAAAAEYASVVGGRENKAKGSYSMILGGRLTTVTATYEAKL